MTFDALSDRLYRAENTMLPLKQVKMAPAGGANIIKIRACVSTWGHTAHRGWARLLLDRARDLIIPGPAQRGANGAAMLTDEDNQDGNFFFNHPGRVDYFAA